MSCTIDHLCIHHRVSARQNIVDLSGKYLGCGESGVLRDLSLDMERREIHLVLEQAGVERDLCFSLDAREGPRNGHMQEYFTMGDCIPPIVPDSTRIDETPAGPASEPETGNAPAFEEPDWFGQVVDLEELGYFLEAANAVRLALPHDKAPRTVAEMYLNRMVRQRQAGDETGALSSFKRADFWIFIYASYAASDGERAARMAESKQFRKSLVSHYGGDPALSPISIPG
jgi:hypothetical protein